MMLAWTTVASRTEAERLAEEAVVRRLAACVQIDGPVLSVYEWRGKVERSEEFRLTFKCLPSQLPALEAHVLDRHPYDTPEWIVVHTDHVGEKYLSWAKSNSSSAPL